MDRIEKEHKVREAKYKSKEKKKNQNEWTKKRIRFIDHFKSASTLLKILRKLKSLFDSISHITALHIWHVWFLSTSSFRLSISFGSSFCILNDFFFLFSDFNNSTTIFKLNGDNQSPFSIESKCYFFFFLLFSVVVVVVIIILWFLFRLMSYIFSFGFLFFYLQIENFSHFILWRFVLCLVISIFYFILTFFHLKMKRKKIPIYTKM